LLELGSLVALLTEAVLLKAAPLARLLGAATTTVNTSVCPDVTVVADSVALVEVVLRLKLSGLPAAAVSDMKVEPLGRVSVKATVCASLGPLLTSVMV